MPWSGGVFSRTNGTHTGTTVWAQDAAAGTGIVTGNHDTHDQDIASGINNCIAKDGSNTPTGNLPMGGFQHTGAAQATTSGQYAEYAQMNAAISAAISSALASVGLVSTGMVLPFLGGVAPSGFVLGAGGTIGNASSSATVLASATAQNLFTAIWNLSNATGFPLYSSGSPVGYGASAASDWAANRAISLPDLRGRAWAGIDNLGGSAASRLFGALTGSVANPTLIGSTGGEEGHTNTINETANHGHTDLGHTHQYTAVNQQGSGQGSAAWFYTNTTTGTTGTGYANLQNTGGGAAHNNMQPTFLGGWIIKL